MEDIQDDINGDDEEDCCIVDHIIKTLKNKLIPQKFKQINTKIIIKIMKKIIIVVPSHNNIKSIIKQKETLREDATTIPIPTPTTNEEKFCDEIIEIRTEIIRVFTHEYDRTFSVQILSAFDNVIKEEHFEDADLIKDDIDDSENSAILEYIFKRIGNSLNDIISEGQIITKLFQNIVNKKAKFNIKSFSFIPKKKDVEEAKELVEAFVKEIYIHPKLLKSKNNSNSNPRLKSAQDKCLAVGKALDLQNAYPILLWLNDSYSRDRIKKFEKKSLDKYDNNDHYITSQWWIDSNNNYTKYIQQRNHEIALPLMTAVGTFAKRALPPIQLNPQLLDYKINDNLNVFVFYTLTSWAFSYDVSQKMESIMPCQSMLYKFYIIMFLL